MRYLTFFLMIFCVIGCSKQTDNKLQTNQQFSNELDQLKEFFQIPGLAVSVSKGEEVIYEDFRGFADVENKVALDSTHSFPIASLTKIFSGIAIMRLVEEGKLDLEESLKTYFPEVKSIGDSIQVKHVLSHTSQGNVGEKFYYSSRFGALTKVIEQASGMSFQDYLDQEIFLRLKMPNTYLLKDSAQIKQGNLNIAKPYILDDGVKEGFIDFGFSSSAGIVSDLQDLRRLSFAMDVNALINEESTKIMFKGIDSTLPYGYGIFKQKIQGVQMVWGYGQYDCYSSLFLKIPEKDLTLILLANNNLMSDPARLIYGDVSDSRFALSFLKNYVLTQEESQSPEFQRKEILAQALAESFMSRFDTVHMNRSKELLESVFEQYPNYLEYADISVLHNLIFLKDVAFYRELGEFNHFDSQIETIGTKLLKEDPQNPYLNIYFGNYYMRKGNDEKAKFHFEQITQAKNFSRNWYASEAENGLKELEN